MDITIIADNGGGLTLQLTTDDGSRYQHTYEDPMQCARDIGAAQADKSFRGWDSNEAEDEDGNDQWLEPTKEQLRNGGYRILSVVTAAHARDDGWRNIRELAQAL